VSHAACDEDFWVDFGKTDVGECIEVDCVVLNAEGVIETLQLWYALLERHLATFETTVHLAATTRLLTFGTTAGSFTALTAGTATLALGAMGTSWCWCKFIYAHG
jgi:hypothetical protein